MEHKAVASPGTHGQDRPDQAGEAPPHHCLHIRVPTLCELDRLLAGRMLFRRLRLDMLLNRSDVHPVVPLPRSVIVFSPQAKVENGKPGPWRGENQSDNPLRSTSSFSRPAV